MNALIEYWPVLMALLAIIVVGAYALYNLKMGTVKEWLLLAVTTAERELGGGTGQIKLRYVYDMFLAKFPSLSVVVSFARFSKLVDEALDKFRKILESNQSIKDYVNSPTKVVIENVKLTQEET